MKQVSSEAFLSLHNRVISSTLSIRCDGKEETESAVKTDLAGAELPNYCQCFQALPHCDSLCFRSFSHWNSPSVLICMTALFDIKMQNGRTPHWQYTLIRKRISRRKCVKIEKSIFLKKKHKGRPIMKSNSSKLFPWIICLSSKTMIFSRGWKKKSHFSRIEKIIWSDRYRFLIYKKSSYYIKSTLPIVCWFWDSVLPKHTEVRKNSTNNNA